MENTNRPRSLAAEAARIAAVALVYFAAAKLGLRFATIGVTATLVWPPSGIAVAALLLFGERMALGVALGAFLANVTTTAPLTVAFAATLGNTAEALAASFLLRRVAGFNPRMQRVRDVIALAILGAAGPSIIAATLGSVSLAATGEVRWAGLSDAWGTWWAGDTMGILLVTPAFLAWLTRRLEPLSFRRVAEVAGLGAAGALVTLMLFGDVLPISATAPFAFVLFPLLLWAALSFGQRGAATGAFLASAIAMGFTSRSVGPFLQGTLVQNLVYLNTFLGVATLSGLTVAAVMSERRRAAAAVRERESRLRAILDNLPAAVWTTDRELRFTSFQGALLGAFSLRPEDVIGKTIVERAGDPDSPAILAHQQALAGEVRGYRVDRGGRTLHGHVEPLRDRTGQIAGTIGVSVDVTEQERIERQHRELVELAPIGIYRASADGGFLAANQAMVEMLGYQSAEEVLRLDPGTELYADPGQFARQLEVQRAGGAAEGADIRWRKRDGRLITVHLRSRPILDAQGRPTEFEMIAEDVSERRTLEGHLLQAQKMEAIGRLAGGVAHDFNNMLTVILGGVHFLKRDLVPDQDTSAMIAEIEQAAQRAQGLTHQLLAFSRRQVLEPRVLDLNALVSSVESMLRRLIGEHVELQVVFGAGLHAVKADPGQLEQAVVNLVVNARDAMPGGGRITIETRNVSLVRRDGPEDPELGSESRGGGGEAGEAGPQVMLAVADNGAGMTAEVRAKAFEPFFTTKPLGEGTGLGLPMVYGIVKQSGGSVSLRSEPGRGTTVSIYLPSAGARVEELEPPPAAVPRPGDETILVAEDDDGVRHWIHNALQGQGYRVFACRNGKEALSIAEDYAGRVHLLLTDIVMPGMNGRELADRLVAQRPGTRVLYMSGYTEEAVDRHGVAGEEREFMQKPFTPRELLEKVRAVLDAGRRAGAGGGAAESQEAGLPRPPDMMYRPGPT
jgi:PAS domain S-box-containing protein